MESQRSHATPDDIELETLESENEDYESGPAEYEITTYPADYTLEGLHDKWKKGEIIIPDFQREFVWKQTQASKLVESFLLGLPVPAIFLYTERSSQKYLVIDGQQRLKSVFYYFEGLFGEEVGGKRPVFRLKLANEDSKWRGKEYADLSEPDKLKLDNSVLRAFVVQQLDPNDDTSVYHIFERLNTGGTLLTNQEVRNCVFIGKFNDLMAELNRNSSWRKILGKPVPDSRKKDIELILRFFALQKIDQYKKPLKDHLSKYMKRTLNPPDSQIEKLRRLFEETCESVTDSLGVRPFHVRRGLNSAVYDSVMVAFALHLGEPASNIKRKFNSLVKNSEYIRITSGSTTDEDSMKKRFKMAETNLFGGTKR